MKTMFILLFFIEFMLHASGTVMSHDEKLYGKTLPIASVVETGPCIDVTIDNGLLYIIGSGTLFIASLADPSMPKIIGRLSGLGNVRQVEIADGYAYITAREDGLYIVDISDPVKPSVVYHYDTLEKATGVAVAGNIVAVACRVFGVELIDISDPLSPKYITTVLAGKEVQSVDIRSGYLYAGVWATRELIVVNIKDPNKVTVTNSSPLDGYGDGVLVKGKLCFAATGHHAPAFTKVHYEAPPPGETAPGFGEGHGMEIFDMTEPAIPLFISRLKTPVFYNGYPDMWGVEVSGSYAVLTDTYNGLFIVDVSHERKPCFIGHAVLPRTKEDKPDAVAAAAIGNGYIYAAGYFSSLYVFEAKGFANIEKKEIEAPVKIPRRIEAEVTKEGDWTVYNAGGQVHSAIFIDPNTIALAAGNAGVHIITIAPQVRCLHVIPSQNGAFDVAERKNMLYVAEGRSGLSIWKMEEGRPVFAGRYIKENISVNQVVVPPSSNYVLVQNAPKDFEIIDVQHPAKPVCMISDNGPGLFYGACISTELIGGRYASVFWHMGGPVWYDLHSKDGVPVRAYDMQATVRVRNIINGMAVHDSSLIVLFNKGYTVYPACSVKKLNDSTKVYKLENEEAINGTSSVFGNVLFTASGAWKTVKSIDISDIKQPRLIEKIQTPGNPGRVVVSGTFVCIPDGHGGLRMANKKEWFKN